MTLYENEKHPWLAAYMTHLLAFALGMVFAVVIL